MLDIKMVRANPDLVKQAMKTRNKDMDAQVDRVIAIDAERRELSAKADGVKARQNAASKDIARLKKGKAPHLDMIQGMAERLGMSIDELVYGRDGIVILTDTEKQRLKAHGRKNLDVLNADEKELLSIYRSIPVEKRSCARIFCVPTLRSSLILPWMPKRKSKI